MTNDGIEIEVSVPQNNHDNGMSQKTGRLGDKYCSKNKRLRHEIVQHEYCILLFNFYIRSTLIYIH